MSFKKILVASDFSACSGAAIEQAIALAQQNDATLTLVHVWEMPSLAYAGMMPLTVDLMTPIQQAAQASLDGALKKLQQRVPRARGLLQGGVAWEEILTAVKETGADLLVVGTHGRTGLRHALLGSVAEKVVRLSPVPVLTVRESK